MKNIQSTSDEGVSKKNTMLGMSKPVFIGAVFFFLAIPVTLIILISIKKLKK